MARLRSCRVSFSHKERKIIRHLLKKAASSNARARYAILLAADENKQKHVPTNSEIASASGVSIPTVIDTLKNTVRRESPPLLSLQETRILTRQG